VMKSVAVASANTTGLRLNDLMPDDGICPLDPD
jgi:hypothetical protein